MAWIKIEHVTPDKPEVFTMADALGIDPDAVVGKLIRFWCWCDQQSVDGNAITVTQSFLDRITHQPGFSDALRKVGWLEVRSGSLQVPRFDRHNGQSAKARAESNRRVAKHRQRSNADAVTNVTGEPLQKPLPEKRREDSIDGDIPREVVTLEKAIAYGSSIGITADIVTTWHETRSRDGWMIHGANGKPRPIMSWQHDLATAKSWRSSTNNHKSNHRKHEYPQENLQLPD